MRFDDPSLLAAICSQPNDDTLRLVYADWLDDHDEPDRAEFIRLQCANPLELCPGPQLAPDACHGFQARLRIHEQKDSVLARQVMLYTSYVRKWNGVIHRRLRQSALHRQVDSRHGLVRGWSYRRGFPCTVWAHINVVAHYTEDLRAIGPIERLDLFGSVSSGLLRVVVQHLESFSLRALDLRGTDLTELQRSELMLDRVRIPGLARLEHLLA